MYDIDIDEIIENQMMERIEFLNNSILTAMNIDRTNFGGLTSYYQGEFYVIKLFNTKSKVSMTIRVPKEKAHRIEKLQYEN